MDKREQIAEIQKQACGTAQKMGCTSACRNCGYVKRILDLFQGYRSPDEVIEEINKALKDYIRMENAAARKEIL